MNTKIAIIGNYAAGKTTFANKLGKLLKIKVYHLDEIYFRKKKDNPDFDWDKYQTKLVGNNKWIIEGNFPRTWDIRVGAADKVIFFNFPIWLSLFRYVYRKIKFKTRDGVGLKEIKKIIFFPKLRVDGDKAVIFRSNKESDDYLGRHRCNLVTFLVCFYLFFG
ncbi:hypothetical protein HYV64_05465 [Candidatus Shapirobacteria bacterium]|nr:hypothetical protein [Candidatus Shapirobacteria bacterium]